MSTPDQVTARRALAIAGVTLAAIVTAAAVFLAMVGRPAANTLEFEAAKAALQVLIVALAGFVLGIVTFYVQQTYLTGAERRRKADERAHERELRDQDDVRREEERIRDERRRQDDVLRSVLDQTITAYHPLKKQRRLLRARVPETLTVATYDAAADALIEIQLSFEQLARMAPLVDRLGRLAKPAPRKPASPDLPRPPFVSLEKSFEAIEGYLQRVVTEYEDKRESVADAERLRQTGVPVAQLKRLSALRTPITNGGDFLVGVSYHVDNVMDVLQTALLDPVDLRRHKTTDER